MSTIPTLGSPTSSTTTTTPTVPPEVAAQQAFVATVSAMLTTIPPDAYDLVTDLVTQVIGGERSFVPASAVPDMSQFTPNSLVVVKSATPVDDEAKANMVHLVQALCPGGRVPPKVEIDRLVTDAAAFEEWRTFALTQLGITAPPVTTTPAAPDPATAPTAPPTATTTVTPAPAATASPTPVVDVTGDDADDDSDDGSGRTPFLGKLTSGLKAVAGYDPTPTTTD